MTDSLAVLTRRLGLYDQVVGVLEQELRIQATRAVVDLCSGSGGVWPELSAALAERGMSLRVTLTDRFPNLDTLRRVCRHNAALSFARVPVDARSVPPELPGFRTMFTSFHHFRPPEAQRILRSAFDARCGIAIFEMTSRSPAAFLRVALGPPACWALTPGMRPLRLDRLLWTYVVPLVPAVLLWDGIVSNLRTYSRRELEALVAPLAANDYQWTIGEIRAGAWEKVPFLIGRPTPARSRLP